MATANQKAEGAFRTIGELSEELGLPQHILRYWETRFSQLRPLTRAGNRRYYRPDDVALVKRIDTLLNQQGYTVKGVQKLLSGKAPAVAEPQAAEAPAPTLEAAASVFPSELTMKLQEVRDVLANALTEDETR